MPVSLGAEVWGTLNLKNCAVRWALLIGVALATWGCEPGHDEAVNSLPENETRNSMAITFPDDADLSEITLALSITRPPILFPPSPTSFMSTPRAVAVCDLDKNNVLDAVVTGNYSTTSYLSVLLGQGGGTFSVQNIELTKKLDPRGIALAHLNTKLAPSSKNPDCSNDNDLLDIVIINKSTSSVGVFLDYDPNQPANSHVYSCQSGSTDCGSEPSGCCKVATSPFALVVSDFDRDGCADIATAGGDILSMLFGDCQGKFSRFRPYTVARGAGIEGMAAGDFNRDGCPDIVTANTKQDTISILLNQPDNNEICQGIFNLPRHIPVGMFPQSVAVGAINIDIDSDIDIVTANNSSNTVSVLLGNGLGEFPEFRQSLVGVNPSSIAIADINVDGKPDIVTSNKGSGDVSILFGKGDGAFAAEQRFDGDIDPQAVAVGAFDADELPDILTVHEGKSARILLSTVFRQEMIFDDTIVTEQITMDGRTLLSLKIAPPNVPFGPNREFAILAFQSKPLVLPAFIGRTTEPEVNSETRVVVNLHAVQTTTLLIRPLNVPGIFQDGDTVVIPMPPQSRSNTESLRFRAQGVFMAAGFSLETDLTESVCWKSLNNQLATISNEPGKRGMGTLMAEGDVTLTAFVDTRPENERTEACVGLDQPNATKGELTIRIERN